MSPERKNKELLRSFAPLLLMLVKAVSVAEIDNPVVIMKGQDMNTIRGLLGDHHRQCDELFATIEQAIEAEEWGRAAEGF